MITIQGINLRVGDTIKLLGSNRILQAELGGGRGFIFAFGGAIHTDCSLRIELVKRKEVKKVTVKDML